MIYKLKKYRISELLMNNETPYYINDERLKYYKKVREVFIGNSKRYLTWVDDKHMQSITTPKGRELTPEELYDFVIGDNITDFAKSKNKSEYLADIAIVLGNGLFTTTRERAIKAFELYKLGLVKKIIFTGGVTNGRDNDIMNPNSLLLYYDNNPADIKWSNLPEADWGAETFISDVYDEDYKKHTLHLSEEFLKDIGVNSEDIMIEPMSKTTQENAEFCKNIFQSEEIETGTKVKSVVLVTTCTHGSRAIRQFSKVFGSNIDVKWCPSTLDLEKYDSLKNILHATDFDEIAFKKELKRIYCSNPELIQKLKEETANHRNAFILGDIDEEIITTIDDEIILSEDVER